VKSGEGEFLGRWAFCALCVRTLGTPYASSDVDVVGDFSAMKRNVLVFLRAWAFVLVPILCLVMTGLRARAVRAGNPFQVSHALLQSPPTFRQVVFGAIVANAPYQGVRETEDAAGRHLGIIEFGQPFDRPVDARALTMIHAHGSLPMVSWYPWTYAYGRHGGNKAPLERYALRKLYNGTYDDVIRREAEDLARFGYPVILRFAPEMNGFWYPWSESPTGNIRGQNRNSNQLGDFVKAWRHVHDLFQRTGATNVIWNWSPNVWYYGQKYPFTEYYPGDGYVDLIGVDGYNWGAVKRWSKWMTPDQVFGRTLTALRRISKRPFILSETASAERGGDKAVWMKQFFAYLKANRDIAAFLWFDLKKETDWRLNSSRASRLAFRSGMDGGVSGSPTTLLSHLLIRGGQR
jgi:hypothetical protein